MNNNSNKKPARQELRVKQRRTHVPVLQGYAKPLSISPAKVITPPISTGRKFTAPLLTPPRPPAAPPRHTNVPTGFAASIQPKKGGKAAREQQKQLRKKANQKVQQGALTGWKMWSTAMCGNHSVSAESGTDSTESTRIDTYITNSSFNWPWTGKANLEGRPHKSCAEAHVYALLIEANKNPKKYTLKSYNSQGNVAPPCRNCKTWVSSAFKQVDGLNANYRSGSTKSTTWAGPGQVWVDE